jgi:vitamin B12 transporter
MKKRIFIVAAVLSSSQLFAQLIPTDSVIVSPTNEFGTRSIELDRVIVTANKFPGKQSQTGKVVSVITRAELEQNSGKTLGEVLNTVVGTTVIGAGNNPGTNLTVSIRGASAGNVLILVDGIPTNDPSTITNYFDLNFFAIDQIERIEILKGGQSTLYGSDAVAGVINIITRKNQNKHFGANASIAGGSYNTFKEFAGIYGNSERIGWNVQYTHVSSDGLSAAYDSTGKNNFDKDGFNQHVLNGSLNILLGKKWSTKVFGTFGHYKTDLDASAFTDEKDYTVKNDNLQSGIGIHYRTPKHNWHLNYVFNYVSRNYLDDSVYKSSPYVDYSKSQYIGRTHFTELYGDWNWDSYSLVAGADDRINSTDQDYFSTGPFGPYSPAPLKKNMSQVSPYASFTYHDGEGFHAELGARMNFHSVYGNNFSYSFNPSYNFGNRAKIFGNIYSAFKTPTLYQLYDAFAGNPDLAPEKSFVAEAGATLYGQNNSWFRVVGFYRNTKNAIQYIVVDPNNFISQYQNVSRQENYGVEAEAHYAIGKLTISLNYTYTDGKTVSKYDGTGAALSKDTVYYNLYRIPKNNLQASLSYQCTKNILVSSQVHYAGKRWEAVYASAPLELKSYYTLDLYGEYKMDKRWKLFIDLKNITDQRYFEIAGYNSRRFNFMVGANVNF